MMKCLSFIQTTKNLKHLIIKPIVEACLSNLTRKEAQYSSLNHESINDNKNKIDESFNEVEMTLSKILLNVFPFSNRVLLA